MEADLMHHDNKEDGAEEEDYVLLDLDAVFAQVNISPDAPYVLSKLPLWFKKRQDHQKQTFLQADVL